MPLQPRASALLIDMVALRVYIFSRDVWQTSFFRVVLTLSNLHSSAFSGEQDLCKVRDWGDWYEPTQGNRYLKKYFPGSPHSSPSLAPLLGLGEHGRNMREANRHMNCSPPGEGPIKQTYLKQGQFVSWALSNWFCQGSWSTFSCDVTMVLFLQWGALSSVKRLLWFSQSN